MQMLPRSYLREKDPAKESQRGNQKTNRRIPRKGNLKASGNHLAILLVLHSLEDCVSFIRTGKCTNTNCPYDHYSPTQMDQIKKALGHGNGGGRDKSRDSVGSKGSNKGRDRGKGKGRGKRENKGESVGAKADSSLDPDGRKWCLAHTKGA